MQILAITDAGIADLGKEIDDESCPMLSEAARPRLSIWRKAMAQARTPVTMRHGTPGTCVDIKVDDVNVATLYLLRVV